MSTWDRRTFICSVGAGIAGSLRAQQQRQPPAATTPKSQGNSKSNNLPSALGQSLYDPRTAVAAADRWAADVSYSLTSRADKAGTVFDHYFSGDTIHLSPQVTKSLIRTEDTGFHDIGTITFDARMIILDMPLFFETARIRFFCDELLITELGEILFANKPRDGSDGITIVASQINLSAAKRRPLHLFDMIPAKDFALSYWPVTNRRYLSVIANTIIPPASAPGTPASNLFTNSTVKTGVLELAGITPEMRSFDLFSPGADRSAALFSVEVGNEAAASAYVKALEERVVWPENFAAKVTRYFSRAPYEPDSSAVIAKWIDYSNKTLGGHRPLAEGLLINIQEAIAKKTDLFGRSQFYVPNIDFVSLMSEFPGKIKAFTDLSAALEPLIVKAEVNTDIDPDEFKGAQQKSQQAAAEMVALNRLLDEQVNILMELQDFFAGQADLIQKQHDVIKEQVEESIRKNETKQVLQVGIKIAMTAASVLPVSAPFAIAASAAINLGGTIIQKANTGESLGVADLKNVYETSKAFVDKTRVIRDSWDGLHKQIEGPFDAQKFGQAASKFGSDVSSILEAVKPPDSRTLSLTEAESKDAHLGNLLEAVAAKREVERATRSKVAALGASLVQKALDAKNADAEIKVITRQQITNDNEIRTRADIAIRVRDRVAADLALQAAELRRAFVYYTGRPVSTWSDKRSSDDVLYFGEMVNTSGPSRIPSDLSKTLSSSELLALLGKQREQIRVDFKSLHEFLDGERYNFENSPDYQINPIAQPWTVALSSQSKPQTTFLTAVNAELQRQTRVEGTAPSAIPIVIPAEFWNRGKNRKLFDIDVDSLSFKRPSAAQGKSFQFQVIHPGFGWTRIDGVHYFVDFHLADAMRTERTMTTSYEGPEKLRKDKLYDRLKNFEALPRRATLLPLITQYYIKVSVDGDRSVRGWDDVPVITKLAVNFMHV